MGKCYELTKDAEKDLREVARYTLDRWGSGQFKAYRTGLEKAFSDLAANPSSGHLLSDSFPCVRVKRYQYHYIFYLFKADRKVVIIGVIHERRDFVGRLSDRIG